MKWLKHYTDTWEDEKISRICDEYGLEIYGFWWRLLEIIAKQMDKTPRTFCQYSPKTWGRFAGISSKKFQKFAEILLEKKLILAEFDGDEIRIDIPNLLKFRDEYSSRKNQGTQ